MKLATDLKGTEMNQSLKDMLHNQESWTENNPLRKFRKENGISLTQIAGMLRVTPTTLNNWESGAVVPSPDNMKRLAKLINSPDLDSEWELWSDAHPQI